MSGFSVGRYTSLLALIGFLTVGCAGVDGDLEEARFLLAKGGTPNINAAITILTPLLTSTNGHNFLEAHRLYGGAKMARAGFSPFRMLSVLFFQQDGDEVSQLRPAFSNLIAESEAELADAMAKLDAAIASSHFTGAPSRTKAGLRFQAGLARFIDSFRIAIQLSGLGAATGQLTSADCQANVGNLANVQKADTNLTDAKAQFLASGLKEGNDLVEYVDQLRAAYKFDVAVDLVEFCNFIEQQSQN